MKKLLVLALIGATMVANAASFNWDSTGKAANKVIYAKGSTETTLYSANNLAMLYLFDAAVVSQDSLLTALRSGDAISTLTSVASQQLNESSKITAQEVTYGTVGNNYNLYMAVLNGNDVLLTASEAYGAQLSDVPDVAFAGLKSISQATGFDDKATFAANGAGWYAVPEPTSGLLLLVGGALLALKRKRA